MDSYVVRRCQPNEARESIEQLWQRNLPLEQGPGDKYRWLYEQAPLPPRDVFVLATSGTGGERAVGTAGVGLREIYVGSGSGANREVLRAGLLADLAVDREHRTVAPALRLVREVRTWALDELDLAYGFPNLHAQGVFRRVGYSALGVMTRYVRVLRYGAYLARVTDSDLERLPVWSRGLARRLVAGPEPARRVASAALELGQLARGLGPLIAARRQYRLEVGAAPPAGIDALFVRCRGEHDVVAVRSTRLLAWRYPPSEGRFWLALRRGTRLDAYAVLESRDQMFHVRDLFGGREAVSALLSLLVVECYRRGAAAVSMRYLGEPWLTKLLEAVRFEARASDRQVFVGVSPKVSGPLRERLQNPGCWFLTDFDEDV